MARLTEAQRRVLRQVLTRNGDYTAWVLGTVTCEALRKRGLLEGEHPFTGRFGNDPPLWITPAGRAALEADDHG